MALNRSGRQAQLGEQRDKSRHRCRHRHKTESIRREQARQHRGDEKLNEHTDRLRSDRNDSPPRSTPANISVEMIGI
jgi:hypothetical protein